MKWLIMKLTRLKKFKIKIFNFSNVESRYLIWIKKNICIIPLRSKSKGLKNKNIKKINKIPLCMFAISETIKSNIFEKKNIYSY